MMRRRLILLCAATALTASACANRIDPLGGGPEMSPPGAPTRPLPSTSPSRVAIAKAQAKTAPEDITSGSLWRSGPTSLFGDRRARTLGDIVTVMVEINEQAQIRNRTNRTHAATENLSAPALFGLPSLASRVLPGNATLDPALDLTSNSQTQGDGTIQRQDQVTLQVAATVVDVLPNGHLVIVGSQEVRVNKELRDLQVAGIIRPEDISRRNIITYEKIADARILYGGRGTISDIQQPRYGQRALDSIMPF